MTTVTLTITVPDLDRLTHALLMAKVTYVCKEAVPETDHDRWVNAKKNIEALNDLYKQIEADLAIRPLVEG